METDNKIIKIENISKCFADKVILNNINLSIERSSITGIIGRSGAGKTTILRILNLLEKPDKGNIFFNDVDVLLLANSDLKQLRRKIGVIFQSFNLLNSRNVYDNIALPLEFVGQSKVEIKNKVTKIAELINITQYLPYYPLELSGGQKQRVAIARALVAEVDMLLCDEFTSALDPKTTLEMLSLLKEINTKLGITIVVISHDMTVIREICDYVYVIDNGEIVETGTIAQIFYNSNHKVTRSLIKDVFAYDIPQAVLSRLVAESTNTIDEVLIRLVFPNNNVQKPFIAHLIMQFNLYVNIISGHYDHFHEFAVGNLLITFKCDKKLYSDIVQLINESNVQYEFLGYLKCE